MAPMGYEKVRKFRMSHLCEQPGGELIVIDDSSNRGTAQLWRLNNSRGISVVFPAAGEVELIDGPQDESLDPYSTILLPGKRSFAERFWENHVHFVTLLLWASTAIVPAVIAYYCLIVALRPLVAVFGR